MPHCEECKEEVSADQLYEDQSNKDLLCKGCADNRPIVSLPHGTIMGREFDYDVSYSRKEGLKASARLGTASLNLHIPQEELSKVIG